MELKKTAYSTRSDLMFLALIVKERIEVEISMHHEIYNKHFSMSMSTQPHHTQSKLMQQWEVSVHGKLQESSCHFRWLDEYDKLPRYSLFIIVELKLQFFPCFTYLFPCKCNPFFCPLFNQKLPAIGTVAPPKLSVWSRNWATMRMRKLDYISEQ